MYNLRRYLQVLGAFLRLLLAIWLRRFPRRIDLFLKRLPRQTQATPEQIRVTLEKLGATFVKFGQLMAMRPDLLPDDYIDEFSKLLDNVPPFDSNIAIRIIESELGKSVSQLFVSFEDQPLAAASFAQVHKATLRTGETVVVKVQRPQLKRLIDADIRLISFLVQLIDLSGIMKRIELKPLVREFAQWTTEELDFVVEASYAERMRRNARDNPCGYIPKVFWNFTTERVLTLEFLHGIWLSDILYAIEQDYEKATRYFAEKGINLAEVAHNIFYNGLQQAFDERLFHADPHAGNLVVLGDNVIGYVDFGIVGQLDEDFRTAQISLLDALQQGNLDRYFRAVLRLMKPPPENVDIDEFRQEVKQNVRIWENSFYNPRSSLRDRSGAWLFTRNMLTARKFGLSFSELTVRYYRALTVVELIVLRLDPTFDFRRGMREYFTKLGVRTLMNDRAPDRSFQRFLRSQLFLRSIPETIDEWLDYIEDQRISIRTAVSGVRSSLSRVFGGLYRVAIIVLLLGTAVRLLFPDLYSAFIPLPWRYIVLMLLVLIPFWAWISRVLYITSVREGATVQRQQ